MPSSYQAVATYSGKVYYNAATGYITTADYIGEVSRDGVESITYQLTYLGAKTDTGSFSDTILPVLRNIWPYLLGGIGLAVIAVLTVLLVKSRREASQLRGDQVEAFSEDAYDETVEEEDDEK